MALSSCDNHLGHEYVTILDTDEGGNNPLGHEYMVPDTDEGGNNRFKEEKEKQTIFYDVTARLIAKIKETIHQLSILGEQMYLCVNLPILHLYI